MIFAVQKTEADTCGNEWNVGEIEHYEAKSLKQMWQKLKKPVVSKYVTPEKSISRFRTPKGKGYGQWEKNPDFNWENDIEHAIEFKSCGFSGIYVYPITVKK